MFTDWKDFYEGSAASYYGINRVINTRPNSPEIDYAYLLKCIFVNCTYSYGGAIYYEQSGGSALIEFCSAIECFSKSSTSSPSSGGFLCASCKNFVVNSLCTFKCTADQGQSIYFSQITEKARIIQSSICSIYTIKEIYETQSPICLYYGNQNCTFLNLSNYKVETYSAIYSSYPSSFNMKYCCLESNFATKNGCLYISSSSGTYTIDNCNILKNIDGKPTEYGTIYTRGTTTIKNCCILDNFANYLFYAVSSTITVINCILSESIKKTGSVTTNKASPTQSFTTDFIIIKNGTYCLEYIDPYYYVSAFPVVVFPFNSNSYPIPGSNSNSDSSLQRSIKEKSTTYDFIESLLYSSLVGYLKQ